MKLLDETTARRSQTENRIKFATLIPLLRIYRHKLATDAFHYADDKFEYNFFFHPDKIQFEDFIFCTFGNTFFFTTI